jgi:hypothetical protein
MLSGHCIRCHTYFSHRLSAQFQFFLCQFDPNFLGILNNRIPRGSFKSSLQSSSDQIVLIRQLLNGKFFRKVFLDKFLNLPY